MKKLITIDDDIRIAAQAYVNAQLATMEKFGAAPELSLERYGQLVYDCAKYPQQLRDMQKRRVKVPCVDGKRHHLFSEWRAGTHVRFENCRRCHLHRRDRYRFAPPSVDAVDPSAQLPGTPTPRDTASSASSRAPRPEGI